MKPEKTCARYGIFPCKCLYCYNKNKEENKEAKLINQKNRKRSLEKRRLRIARKAQKSE